MGSDSPLTLSSGRCPLCGGHQLVDLLAADGPRSCQTLVDAPLADAGSGPLRITLCATCDLSWNAAYHPSAYASTYGDQYYSSFTASESGRRVQQDVERLLNAAIGLQGKTVVKIGSGDGYFLELLAASGARAIGFETSPASRPANASAPIKVRREYFDFAAGADVGGGAELLVMRHVLEHLPSGPSVFAQLAGATFAGRRAQWLYIEVPDVSYLLEHHLYCDFYYDHIWYFSQSPLTRALEAAGWRVCERVATPAEFVGLLAERVATPRIVESAGRLCDAAMSFAARYQNWRDGGERILAQVRRDGARLGVWGAGARGARLLHTFGLNHDTMSCLVDTDPRKQRRFIPGIEVAVEPPSALADRADIVLVTSHSFFDEIVTTLPAVAGRELPLIKPYPEFSVLSHDSAGS